MKRIGSTSVMGAVVAGIFLAGAMPSVADERKFTYSYEAKTLPEGTWEFEQWATLRARKDAGRFYRWDLREELEYGITDRLNTALYLNFRYEAIRDVAGKTNKHDFDFKSVSSEWKYKLADPTADLVGALAYAEVSLAEDEYELELKAVASKELGEFTFAYNFVFEGEREYSDLPNGNEEGESEFLIEHTFGASYHVFQPLNVGVEALFRTPFEHNLSDSGDTSFFVGPNVNVSTGGWWVTLTLLKQVDVWGSRGLDLVEREKYEARIIVGINF